MRVKGMFLDFACFDASIVRAACMIPTRVRPSGVTVRPSIPLLGSRYFNSAGSEPS